MIHPNYPFLRSVGMMIGAIVGVGVFGLPYAFAQSGLSLGLLELLILGAIMAILALMLGEVVVQTPGRHRLVTYIGMYLGDSWRWVTLVALGFGVWGAMLAYMVVGGQFLHILLSPLVGGDTAMYSYLIGFLAAALVFGGLKFASKIEYIIVAILLLLFIFIILASAPHIDPSHFTAFDFSNVFIPYGVIIFALTGAGVIPELKDVLGGRHKRYMPLVIVMGFTIVMCLYALFSLAVVGVTGADTSPSAFAGLIPKLGETFRVVATLLGSVTILSIYMVLGVELLNTFKYDFGLPHRVAWLLVCFTPVILFAMGVREFIDIIGFVGGVFNGFLGILVALCYWTMRRRGLCRTPHCINFPVLLTWLVIAVFSGGIIWELVHTLVQ